MCALLNVLTRVSIFTQAVKIIDLILLKACYKCALVFLKHHLGNKLTDALHLDPIYDFQFVVELIWGVLVTLKFSKSLIEPVLTMAAAWKEELEEQRPLVVKIAIEVLTTSCNRAYHSRLGFPLICRNYVVFILVTTTRRCRKDTADEWVIVSEGLVGSEAVFECRPNNARETTDKAEHNVKRGYGPCIRVRDSWLIKDYSDNFRWGSLILNLRHESRILSLNIVGWKALAEIDYRYSWSVQ